MFLAVLMMRSAHWALSKDGSFCSSRIEQAPLTLAGVGKKSRIHPDRRRIMAKAKNYDKKKLFLLLP